MAARVVAERSGRLLAKEPPGMSSVALLVLEEPYVDDLLRVLLEEGPFQPGGRPAHRLHRSFLDASLSLVADDDKGRLHDHGEVAARRQLRQLPAQLHEVPGVLRSGKGRPLPRQTLEESVGLQPQTHDGPASGVVLERPEPQEQRSRHAPVAPPGLRGLVIDHLVLCGVVAEDQAKMLRRLRLPVVARADDGGDPPDEIGVEIPPQLLEPVRSSTRVDPFPHSTHLEPDAPQGSLQLPGVAASPQKRVETRCTEDVVLGERSSQLPQVHLGAGFPAEVRLLANVRYSVDEDIRVRGSGDLRRERSDADCGQQEQEMTAHTVALSMTNRPSSL